MHQEYQEGHGIEIETLRFQVPRLINLNGDRRLEMKVFQMLVLSFILYPSFALTESESTAVEQLLELEKLPVNDAFKFDVNCTHVDDCNGAMRILGEAGNARIGFCHSQEHIY